MYRPPSRHRPSGGGRRQPPQPQGPQPVTPDLFARQNPFLQNHLYQLNYQQQSFNNVAPPNSNLFPLQNSIPNPNHNFSSFQNHSSIQNPPQSHQNPPQSHQNPSQSHQNPKVPVEKVDRAVRKARKDLLAAGEHVSAWKVSQSALVTLKVDSWGSLGLRMQQVPSLHSLMVIEGKINAFIHCFVGVRRVTTLYDLELAVCNNEGIEKFEELELGPLLQHPLVVHYFSVSSDTKDVFQITSEEILNLLSKFLITGRKKSDFKVEVEEFLEFIARKKSAVGKEMLGIRIQSLGLHIGAIRGAERLEHRILKKYKEDKKEIFLMQKKELNERFSAITQRVESFTSAHNDFCGKHIRFVASSSGDEENNDSTYEDDDNGRINSPSQSPKSADRVSKCPYPSLNEEIRRLGLKGEVHGQTSQVCVSPKQNRISGSEKSKRKSDNLNISGSPKLRKRKVEADVCFLANNCDSKELGDMDSTDLSVPENSLRMFVTTWKEACQRYNAAEVLEKMLQFYGRKLKRKRIKTIFSSHPFIGLLNVAISSIKCGMWDSIYDALQSVSLQDLTMTPIDKGSKYESISVEPNLTGGPTATECIIEHRNSVPLDDIIRNIAAYFELDHGIQTSEKSDFEKRLIFSRNLYDCEHWLMEKFNVEEFRSLGYGDFIPFLEKHSSLLPQQSILLTGETSRKWPLEACMFHHQLVDLASQASNNLWENEKITTANILLLLRRQFPSIGFKAIENGPVEDFLSIVAKHKNNVISKSLIFSATLSGTNHAVDISSHSESGMLEHSSVKLNSSEKSTIYEAVTSKDAIEVLLKAPMLSDLNLWSHWDLKFAPSLGPFVPWLLNEVKTDQLLCLFTRDGRIIRLDHSATVDSFLEAAIQGSSFLTAVKLLSLFSIVGGERNVPVSLLKCHAQRSFEVMLRNFLDSIQTNGRGIPFKYGRIHKEDMIGEITSCNDGGGLQNNLSEMNIAVSTLSRFVLECLHYLPAEFRGFVANILLSGMRSVVKDAPSAILSECSQTEQRLMLHEVGLSIGVLGWIDDFVSFSSSNTSDLALFRASCSEKVASQKCSGIEYKQDMSDKCFSSEEPVLESVLVQECTQLHTQVSAGINSAKVSDAKMGSCCIQQLSDCPEDENAALVVESIRRDEFGLDPSFSNVESSMLKKQHARLGRALHCLSQELYSQDSHFLLELVQNADDNTYSERVEPTLVFLLQRSGIVVLNNERGFAAQNIKALCDVGNSTKKGSNAAGYIGKKGIGFKSVFRVTDAPEIHSNGFHIKFDISEGQIGFVLPSIVPPCNLDFFNRLASCGSDQRNCNWNTCIVLPFTSRLQEETALKVIMTMFSDLHPSLLLFLHRLQCIKFRNLIDDSSIVMRKEIVGDGIIRVSHGKDKMTWLVVSQKLQADLIRNDVKTTEISIAFTLQESDDSCYRPYLHQQPVFAFLPLRTYGMRFILQGDFVLPSSREEVDGDSPWNQWLLSEFPGLFVNAEKSFCALPSFRDNPGKAVAAYMSYVPLVGEVQGFFSSLPRSIISKLRMSNCLLVEGSNNEWVPPCKVLRGWNEQARSLLPDSLLREHLGLGFLDRCIVLSDALACALGVEEYGPKVLLQILSSLCQTKNGLISMGVGWLSSFLITLDMMLVHYLMQSSLDCEAEFDFMKDLQRISFIPLSNGTYAALNEGTIWLHDDIINTGIDGEYGVQTFPNLYSKLRILNPALLLASSLDSSHIDLKVIDKLTNFFYKIGVQRLSAHEIIKLHILPAISDQRSTHRDDDLMTEYVCFVMFHLQSSCHGCRDEREYIISELRNRAYILTNNGFKQLAEVSIHFSNEFGNPVNINKLVNFVDVKWYEIDISYLRHPISKSITSALTKWREFFQELGVTDFVEVVQVEKSVGEMFNSLFKDSMSEIDMILPGSTAKDWESLELVNLLSLLSRDQNRNACQYLLEVLDMLWDSCFSDKAIGYYTSTSTSDRKPFKSSFMSSICDVPWIVSTMDNELHYPKDIFHDCDEVRTILGMYAPYAVPKVRSAKLLSDIGFKTRVTLEDAIRVLKVWKSSEIPFKASVAYMSKLYTFIWNEIAVSKKKLAEELYSMPFIFVPYTSGSTHEDIVSGMFFSCGEVYWHDPTGCMNQMKIHTPGSSTGLSGHPLDMTLSGFYPTLHDFFVHGCGVRENPPLCGYLQILLQLSNVVLPSQAANAVFQVFLKWSDGLKSGLSSEDVAYLKEFLKKKEFTVLPTVQDRWVSLHSCFGLVCWCDEKKLRKQFKHLDGIDFLYFGELSKNDKEMLRTKVSVLMKTLGIPALSEVVSREPIYYGIGDPYFKSSLVDWALPYAQRYIYNMHPDKYSELKQSGFDFLSLLRVVVVEKLFYINVIKSCGIASERRVECSCLLHDNYLYSTPESDVHALFMELSCLFFDGNPDLHFANFLHMITTKAESGSTEDQTELFILNSQKIPKLPDGQSVWALSSTSTFTEKADTLESNLDLAEANDKSSSKSKKKSGNSNWPPVDWKTAPGFGYARANGFQTQPPAAQASNDLPKNEEGDYQDITDIDMVTAILFDKDWDIEDEPVPMSTAPVFPDSNDLLGYCNLAYNETDYGMNGELDIGLDHVSENAEFGSSNFSNRVQLRFGTPDAKEAVLTGRLGEHLAFKYFVGKAGKAVVRWVNEDSETGLPYDIVIGEKEGCREFVEVKSTKSPRKDWFLISMREWQFAIEKGEAFSVARVALLGNNVARVSVFKNPAKLCQQGKLQLVMMMPKKQNEFAVVS